MTLATNIGQIVGFNQLNRNKWVASLAMRLPLGTSVIDVGAGECRKYGFKPVLD